jgi:hypothetical protein
MKCLMSFSNKIKYTNNKKKFWILFYIYIFILFQENRKNETKEQNIFVFVIILNQKYKLFERKIKKCDVIL